MKKNNVKVMFLTLVATLGLLTGCAKNSNKNESATPEGYYQVTSYMQKDKTLKDGAHVDFWIPFIGDLYGYHDASWRAYTDYGTDVYHYSGSHGCVNSPYSAAEILYDNVTVGTKVLIHK